jgi:hypothetical protein
MSVPENLSGVVDFSKVNMGFTGLIGVCSFTGESNLGANDTSDESGLVAEWLVWSGLVDGSWILVGTNGANDLVDGIGGMGRPMPPNAW